jgi:hypothetical protein
MANQPIGTVHSVGNRRNRDNRLERWQPADDVKARLAADIERQRAADSKRRPDAALEVACAFHYSAVVYDILTPLPQDRPLIAALPAFIDVAFACELYFKVILRIEKLSSHGHKLSALFSRMPQHWQQSIINYYIVDPTTSETNFGKAIVSISSIFEEWRYIYEFEGEMRYFDLDVLLATTRAALLAIRDATPGWTTKIVDLSKLTAPIWFQVMARLDSLVIGSAKL